MKKAKTIYLFTYFLFRARRMKFAQSLNSLFLMQNGKRRKQWVSISTELISVCVSLKFISSVCANVNFFNFTKMQLYF